MRFKEAEKCIKAKNRQRRCISELGNAQAFDVMSAYAPELQRP